MPFHHIQNLRNSTVLRIMVVKIRISRFTTKLQLKIGIILFFSITKIWSPDLLHIIFTKEIIFEHRHHRQKQTYCIISLYRTPTLTNIRAKKYKMPSKKNKPAPCNFFNPLPGNGFKDKIFFYTKNRMKVPVNRLFLTIFAVIPPTYSKAAIIL